MFSGIPVRVVPEANDATFKITATQSFIEWQVLKVGSMDLDATLATTNISINNFNIDHQSSVVGHEKTSGIKYKLDYFEIGQKAISFRLHLDPSNLTEAGYGLLTIRMQNSKGEAEPVSIRWSKDSFLSPWTEWSSCPIECVPLNGTSGQRTRHRNCTEGYNSENTCAKILDPNASNNMESTYEICPLNDMKRLKQCKVEPRFTEWSHWNPCSANCGPAKQTRFRGCIDGMFGGGKCSQSTEVEEKDCSGKVHCAYII